MRRAILLAALPLLSLGVVVTQAARSASEKAAPTNPSARQPGQIVGMRRLSESQYRNSIADIFGPDISVIGRFEPVVRPTHQLVAVGAAASTLSPAGLEQFDAIGRGIASQVFDAAHRSAFIKCTPADPAKADDSCARQVLAPIGRYLFRRPLTDAEQASYVQMARAATGNAGDFYAGLELALGAMLVSPNFLYVVESGEPDPAHPGEMRLDNYSRAARLSYLLWDTTPGSALLDAADRGELADQARFTAIARKMVHSPRLEAGARAFFADMLLFEKFDDMSKDSVVYPRFNPDVAKALPEQMLRTITDLLVTRGEDYRDLFTSRRTFMTRALGTVYNVPVRSPHGWESYEFGPNDDRDGLLSLAGFLALYSHEGRSSPTLRGRAIRELLLCQPVPDPPANVNFSVVQDTSNKALPTARDRLSMHATNPVCGGCHRITDPIGLTLEGFDGIGATRLRENDAEINRTGTFEGKEFVGASGLGKVLAANPSSTQCVGNRMFEYATGRPTEGETGSLAAIEKAFAASKYNFPALMLQVATMPSAYAVPKSSAAKTAMSVAAQTRIGAR